MTTTSGDAFAKTFSQSFIRAAAFASAAFAFALASGCQPAALDDLLQGRKINYRGDDSQGGKPLEHPPDILSDAAAAVQEDDESVSLSRYRIADVPDVAGEGEVAPAARSADVALRGEGNLQWLEAELPPEEAWAVARGFWTERMGFPLERDEPRLGFMETEWLDLRSRRGFGLAGVLDRWLNRVRDSGQRDKFRVRVDPADDRERSRIYIAHRHITEVFNQREGTRAGIQAMPPDPHLEAEMLRRMMLYIAGEDLEDLEVAAAESGTESESTDGESDGTESESGSGSDAESGTEGDGTESADEADGESEESPLALSDDYELGDDSLLIRKPLREAYLLVRIGLDRGGFTLEDRDVSAAAFYIRHTGGPESDRIFGATEDSFFNRLFVRADPVVREIKIQLTDEGENAARVRAEAFDDEGDLTPKQSSALLRLLAENLP